MPPPMNNVSAPIVIDDALRFVLFGLQCACGVEFSGRECERVFSDSRDNQVSAKSYVFFDSARLCVTGTVEEYEPETLILTVRGKQIDLLNLIERARYEVARMKKAEPG